MRIELLSIDERTTMINRLSQYSTIVNEKLRLIDKTFSLDEQKLIQLVYILYIENVNLHKDTDNMIKIGTCTMNRFKDRLIEHTRNFSSNITVIDILIISNASQEKAFHTLMDKSYKQYILELETPNGKFKEIYTFNDEVINAFYNFFNK
jgi:hypothetical protein